MKNEPQSIEAFILAAGKGCRLGALTNERPKCLLEVGGRTLLERSLSAMADAGLASVHLVVGFNGHIIRDYVARLNPPLRVTILDNPYWRETGSVVSLDLAIGACGNVWGLVVESDLLYHHEFLSRALADRRDKIMLADPSGSGDEVWVVADATGGLAQLGKGLSQAQRTNAKGEFAGITLLSPSFLQRYKERSAMLLRGGAATGHYEELVFEISQEGMPISVEHCPGLPWTEIDTPADLSRAVNRVLPALFTSE